MLCPSLSSTVSVWLLTVCIYITFKKNVSLYFFLGGTNCPSVLFDTVQCYELILGYGPI